MKHKKINLSHIYKELFNAFGPQHWWPGETSFEVIVGTILTQNTNWGNVERAVNNLKSAGKLNPKSFKNIPEEELAKLIKPAGYFNVKAKRLKSFIKFFFSQYDGDIDRMKKVPLNILRQELLGVNGIGPETADSILLYALEKPIFVVDAYTKRFLIRHKVIKESAVYGDIQKLFMDNLPRERKLFNEFHALIVKLGKEFCRSKPKCLNCPLGKYL